MITCQDYCVADPDAFAIDTAGEVVDYYLHTARDRL